MQRCLNSVVSILFPTPKISLAKASSSASSDEIKSVLCNNIFNIILTATKLKQYLIIRNKVPFQTRWWHLFHVQLLKAFIELLFLRNFFGIKVSPEKSKSLDDAYSDRSSEKSDLTQFCLFMLFYNTVRIKRMPLRGLSKLNVILDVDDWWYFCRISMLKSLQIFMAESCRFKWFNNPVPVRRKK